MIDRESVLPRQLIGRLGERWSTGTPHVRVAAYTLWAERDTPDGGDAVRDPGMACLVTEVVEQGGEILSLRPEALIAWWPAADAGAARQVLACGRALLAERGASRVAVHHGTLIGVAVGGHADRWIACATGDAVRGLATLARFVRPGALEMADAVARAAERPPEGDPPPAAHAPLADDVLKRFETGSPEAHTDERRVLTTLVARVALDGGPDELRALQRAALATQETLARWGGALVAFEVGDHVVEIVVAFGLASSSVELRPELAVGCALELVDALSAQGIGAACGLATGRTLAGWIGAASRRSLALVGPSARRARTLATAISGLVLCDGPTHERCRGTVLFEEPLVLGETLDLPGDVARPLQLRQSTEDSAYGRVEELKAINQVLDDVDVGETRVLVWEGEPGIGKTHLLVGAQRRAWNRGWRVLSIEGDPIVEPIPWRGLRPTLARLLGFEEGDTVADRERRARAWLSSRELKPDRVALLNPVLDTAFAETPRTRELRERMRLDATRELLVDMLATHLSGGRAALFVDDVQWVDPPSLSVCSRLRASLVGLAVFVAWRSGVELSAAAQDLVASGRRRALSGLSRGAMTALLAKRLGVSVVPPQLLAFVQRRAQGHPLFSVELVLALQSEGLVSLREGRLEVHGDDATLDRFPPPATIRGTLGYRLDQLDETARATLEAASVLGFSFTLDELSSLMPSREASRVRQSVEDLADARFVRAVGVDRWMFASQLLQEVAYHRLEAAERGRLHDAEARRVEQVGGPGTASLVAWHRMRTDHYEEALPHLERAWAEAEAQGAKTEAATMLELALSLDDRAREEGRATVEPLRRARWLRRLAEVGSSEGNHLDSETHARAALEELGVAAPRASSGGLLQELGVHLAHRVLPASVWRRNEAQRGRGTEIARSLDCIAESSVSLVGRGRTAIVTSALAAVNEAERIERDDTALVALGILGLLAIGVGMNGLAEFYRRRMVDAARPLENARIRATVANVSVLLLSAMGRLQAVKDEAREVMSWFGDRAAARRVEGSLRSIMAFNHYLEGDLDGVREWSAGLVHDATPRHRAWGLNHRARLALVAGDAERAEMLARQAWDLLEGTGDGSIATSQGLVIEAQARQGRLDEAWRGAGELVEALASTAVTFHTRLLGFFAPVQVVATVLAESPEGRDRGLVRAALRQMRRYAWHYRIGVPHVHLARGLVAQALGRAARARQAFRRAEVAAAKLGLSWVVAQVRQRRDGPPPDAPPVAEASPPAPTLPATLPSDRGSVAASTWAMPYHDEGLIGQGGHAMVRRVRDPVLKRPLAMKILTSRDADARRRFLSEARIMARLAHPNIVPIYAFDADADARPYICMKLLAGETLAERLYQAGEQRLLHSTLTEHLHVLDRVCDALVHAHAQGIVHLDVKPHNVMVGAFGEVFLMDWGIAASLRADDTDDVVHTVDVPPGLGTPGYMAPEQAARGRGRIDERTDVFGLGGLLHAVLTGAPPRPTVAARGPVPDGLLRLAERATSDEPGQRHATVADFRADLRVQWPIG